MIVATTSHDYQFQNANSSIPAKVLYRKNVPRVYKGNNLSASGRISCPDDETVAQNFRYE